MAYRRTAYMQERVSRRKQQMIKAAEELISEHGYKSMTMQDVAKRAKTSIGNVYFYFSNKDEMVMEVIDHLCQEIWDNDHFDKMDLSSYPHYAIEALDDFLKITAIFQKKHFAKAILGGATYPGFRDRILAYFEGKAGVRYAKYSDFYEGVDRDLAFACHFGSVINVMMKVLKDELDRTPEEVGKFLARWKLQARGLQAEIVDKAMADLDTLIREVAKLKETESASDDA
ncbi:helix-turn-helix domain-containing protein [Balneolaceae bacterium ANBcel3]|nr:helix-turn-helix domain-containing protein [Balneolaceae bacterium ANBcel3]